MKHAMFSAVSVLCLVAACGQARAGQDDPTNALKAELSADALAKSQYMEKANGFSITDGTNKLRVGGWAQFRYLANFRDDPANSGGAHDSGFTSGFELARTRLNFSGNVLDPNLKFKIEGDFSRTTGDFGLLDSFATYSFQDSMQGFTLRAGQFKAPLLREQLVSDTNQLAVERSVVDSVFNQSRSQGVEMQYAADTFRGVVNLNDGLNSLNTVYTSTTEADIGVTARGEFKFGDGDWKRYDDFTSWRKSPTGGMVGVAGHWQHAGNTATPGGGTNPVAQTDLFVYTADLSIEGDGWNVFGEFVGSHFEGDESSADFDDFGAVIQAGVFVADNDEIFGRWDCVFPDSDRSADKDFNTLTAGWNHYFVPESQALKFTADVCWFIDTVADNALVSTRTNGRNALLPDVNDNQFALRLQLQFMF